VRSGLIAERLTAFLFQFVDDGADANRHGWGGRRHHDDLQPVVHHDLHRVVHHVDGCFHDLHRAIDGSFHRAIHDDDDH
jgi:hypothetical protein